MENLIVVQFVNGVSAGALYAIVAIGLSLIYGILGVAQFGHGTLYMLGAYVGLTAMGVLGGNYWLALVTAVIALALFSLPLERFVFRPLYTAPHINGFLAALGLIYVLDNSSLLIWGGDYQRFPSPYQESISLLGMEILSQRLIMLGVCLALIAGVSYFVYGTTTGRTIRAAAQSREGLALCGISFRKVSMLTFAISGGLAAAAGVLVAPIFYVFPGMGLMPTIKGFVIVILGGMGSVPGAALGGFLLGLAESYGTAFISPAYKEFFAFAILVLVLAIRPTGLFGAAEK